MVECLPSICGALDSPPLPPSVLQKRVKQDQKHSGNIFSWSWETKHKYSGKSFLGFYSPHLSPVPEEKSESSHRVHFLCEAGRGNLTSPLGPRDIVLCLSPQVLGIIGTPAMLPPTKCCLVPKRLWEIANAFTQLLKGLNCFLSYNVQNVLLVTRFMVTHLIMS